MAKKCWPVHWNFICSVCGKVWQERNAVAVAAIHYKKTGHAVHGEVGIAYEFSDRTKDK